MEKAKTANDALAAAYSAEPSARSGGRSGAGGRAGGGWGQSGGGGVVAAVVDAEAAEAEVFEAMRALQRSKGEPESWPEGAEPEVLRTAE